MLNTLPFSNRFLPHKEMPAATEIDQHTMRGSCWNPTEPMALTSGQSQQRIDQQQQQQVTKDERQQPLLSAATPAWGLMMNGSQKDSQRSGPNSPTETATSFAQPTFGAFDFASQLQSRTSPSYSSPESSVVKAEPQEHPEYDSGRETLNEGEDDDMIEMSPEVLVQAELSESRESNAAKQTPKRQVTRKLLKCPMCNYESDTLNKDFFMDHLVTHCLMANRAPVSTPTSTRSEDETQTNEEETENEYPVEDDASLRMPQITSQGNVKFYRCKKCKAPSLTKYDSWIHQREHMTPDKILYCKVCPFATEYKHHLEYHMRNHYGSKPFKCPKCNYTCVNKSMLNSHLKSHSSIYQYRCASCSYVTKYCHSLKVHLKRNMHEPAVVLNPDGTPNPNPIIDINSSRRGPRTKPHNILSNTVMTSPESSPKYEGQVAPLLMYPEPSMNIEEPKPKIFFGQFESQNLYNGNLRRDILEQTYRQNQQVLVQNANLNFMATNPEQIAAFQKNLALMGYMQMIQDMRAPQSKAVESDVEEPDSSPEKVLNESWSSTSEPLDLSNKSDTNSVDGNSPAKRRRKGVAVKLGKSALDSDSESRVEIESLNDGEENEKHNEDSQGRIMVYKNGVKQNMYFCRICDIIFRNEVMFTIHMGYHGRNDPLSCNICGERCPDHVTFFVHVTRNEH